MCCLQKVRCRGQRARFVSITSRTYELWWSENDGIKGVEILVKEELCQKVVEVRRKSYRVMAMALVFDEKVITVICAYVPPVG